MKYLRERGLIYFWRIDRQLIIGKLSNPIFRYAVTVSSENNTITLML